MNSEMLGLNLGWREIPRTSHYEQGCRVDLLIAFSASGKGSVLNSGPTMIERGLYLNVANRTVDDLFRASSAAEFESSVSVIRYRCAKIVTIGGTPPLVLTAGVMVDDSIRFDSPAMEQFKVSEWLDTFASALSSVFSIMHSKFDEELRRLKAKQAAKQQREEEEKMARLEAARKGRILLDD